LNLTPISNYNWSFGDGSYSSDANPSHVFASFGVFDVNHSVTTTYGSDYELKKNYIVTSTSQQQQTTFYVPSLVRFKLYDFSTSALDNMNVSVCPLDFTAPDNWTSLLIGIKPDVNIVGTCLQGYTGSDGSVAFPMLAAIQYRLTIGGVTANGRVVNTFTYTTYPSQADIAMTIPTVQNPGPSMTNAPTNVISYTIYNKTYSATQNFYNASYTDPTGGTDRIQFFMEDYTGNITYTTTITGAGANTATFSNITSNTNGGSVSCGFIANQTVIGNVSSVYTNTFPNYLTLSGGALPDWPETWAAVILIFAVGAFFSFSSIPVGGLVVVGMTAFFTYVIRWITPVVGEPAFGTTLASIAVLAGLLLLRKKEDLLS
jgi:PKD repeat protein